MKRYQSWLGIVFLAVILSGMILAGCTRNVSVAPTVLKYDTPTPTSTATLVPTNTPIFTPTPSWTPTVTGTPTPSLTPTWTCTWTSTHTPIFTDTPCGYPGDTCTMTFTVTDTPTRTSTFTATHTHTPSPTHTRTVTVTPTPSVMPTPRGVIGAASSGGYPQVSFIKDTNPYITGYDLYGSLDGSNWNLLASFPVTMLPPAPVVIITHTAAGTTFNRYYYVVATGTLPNSAPSSIVHAVSGTTTLNGLTVNASSSLTPVFSIVGGSVPAAVYRTWSVVVPGGTPIEWFWNEEGVSLASVNYGFNGFGLTYYPAAALSSASSYNIFVLSFNNENWNIDVSGVNFATP